MSDVKWIKLSTNMFEDEKIRLIEQMPEADTILIIWVKLMSQAGKTNASGYIYLSENIPYTEEMLATIFNRPISTVRLALQTFEQFGMLTIDDDHFISINNWEKHQNIEGMERVKKLNAERNRRYRERKKQQQLEGEKSTDDVSVTSRDGTDIELELEEELDIERDKEHIVEIINYLNDASGKKYRASTQKTKTLINARKKEGFTVNDFKKVIDVKTKEWKNDKNMSKFLRPETLFGTKFEGYLNQENLSSGYDPDKDSF